MSLNKVMLIGNLGRDPEIRTTQDGRRIGNMALATTEKWTDKSGQRQERTEWHRIVLFNDKLVDLAERYLVKGSQIYIEGQLQTRKYTDQAGVEKSATEVVLKQYDGVMRFLGGKKPESAPAAGTTYAGNPDSSVTMTAPNGAAVAQNMSEGIPDDIPF